MPAFFSRNGSLTGGDLEANDIKSAAGGVLVVDTSETKSSSSSESCSSNSESGDNRFGCFTSFSLCHFFHLLIEAQIGIFQGENMQREI